MNELLRARESVAQDADTPWETDVDAEEYAEDPKAFILKRCKYFLSTLTMSTNNIMVATYFPPATLKMKGPDGKAFNLILTDKTTGEAKWQSRVGLLLAKGPMAWKTDDRVSFGGSTYEVGEWVCYDRQDGRQIAINRVHCRRLKDVDVWGSTTDPYLIY